MPLMNVCIPENIRFSDLRLARDADGMVSTTSGPRIDAICKGEAPDRPGFSGNAGGQWAALINEWYRRHRRRQGRWTTQEEMIAEALAEDAFGGGFS